MCACHAGCAFWAIGNYMSPKQIMQNNKLTQDEGATLKTLSRSAECPMIHATIEIATEQQGRPMAANTSWSPSMTETTTQPYGCRWCHVQFAMNTRGRGIDSGAKAVAFASSNDSDKQKLFCVCQQACQ